MGGFTPPVPQTDSDWEIRVAVLFSLFLQILLIFVGPVRKRSSSPVPRFLVWSCYLLADWVADLALGLLLNNLGNIGGNGPGAGGSSSISHSSGLKRGPGGNASSSGGDSTSSPVIFAFWTPFLLLHLGGPDTITAYSLEDNELWLRHLIGLFFELFSALVVFSCSIKGNHMIPATVLIFVVGIIKYGERTYSLYSGSVDGFREKILDDPNPGPNYAKLMTEFDSKEKAGLVVEIIIADGEAKKAQAALDESEVARLVKNSEKSLEVQAYEFFLVFRRLFVNLILSYKERKISRAYFLEGKDVTATKAFQVIEVELNFIYDMVYTKAPVVHSKAGYVLRFVGSAGVISSLVIFFFKHKGGYMHVDVGITYALLLGGLALDMAALVMLLSSHWMLVYLEGTTLRGLKWLAHVVRRFRLPLRRWSERTSQLSLISYCLCKPDPYREGDGCRWSFDCRWRFYFASRRVIRAIAKKLGLMQICDDFPSKKLHVTQRFDDFFFIRREPLRCRHRKGQEEPILLQFIFDVLRARSLELKNEDMKKACEHRGEGVLLHDKMLGEEITSQLKQKLKRQVTQEAAKPKSADEKEDDKMVQEKVNVLVGSIQREFDESLLLWHIATDLCFHPLAEQSADKEETSNKNKPISRTLSGYTLYLLIKQPEMLSTTAGIGLLRYRDTCAEARRFFESAAEWDPKHDDAQRMLLNVNTTRNPSEVKGDRSKSVLFDAVILAKVLRELDADLMWEVVAKVWVEMLTFATGKCRGSTHVRQLSHGGELITMVWFLMAHMGLGDMYQIQEGDAKAKLIVHDQ